MIKPIHVMHVIDSLAPGGAERMLVELVNNTDRDKVIPYVCVTRKNLNLKQFIHPDIQTYCLDRKHTWDLRAMRVFKNIILDNEIKIAHVHGYGSYLFVFAAKTLLHIPIKILLHVHSSNKPDLYIRIFGRFGIDYFIGVSSAPCVWANEYLNLPDKKITLIQNAINPDPYKKATPIDLTAILDKRPSKVGVVIANVRPVKDLITLFQALSFTKNKNNISLLIAGSTGDKAYFKECTNELNRLGLQDQVKFLGVRTDLPRLLASVDFGVLSSESETGPVALLEYIAAGLPFVVTRVGQIGEEVSRAGIPETVPIKNPKVMAKAIDRIFDLPPNEKLDRAETSNKLFDEMFNIKHYSHHWYDIYSGMVQ